MKVWNVVSTIWVWWTSIAVSSLMVVEQDTLSYEEVKFTTNGATKNSYTQFMEAMRDKLGSGEERHAIPVMREPSTVPDSQRFVLVELSNWAEQSVTLAVDLTNAYVVAYRAGNQSYFFHDAPAAAFSNLFTDTQPQSLRYGSSYVELERVAGDLRENISLGISALEEAISSLRRTSTEQERTVARSLIISVQMVSEAARFKYIEQRVRQSIRSGEYQTFRPDAAMLSLEQNWGGLSTAVQESNQGVFSRPVQLQRANYTSFDVTSVTQSIIANLAIMVFVCRDRASQFSILLISSVVADDDDTCADPEPTVRISGRNGLCVDVRDGKYNDGNPIQLWPCKEQSSVNQLWTLKRDGTIRSNGKCLTTYGYSPRDYVMIYDCTTAVPAATLWQVWDNGTIINPQSALTLSANSGDSGTTLTVETNIYATRQGWLAGNNSEPFVTSIVGYLDLCMQANGNAMWLVECESSKAEQKWAIYPDGSLRPQQNHDNCLTSDEHVSGSNIIILGCSPGWTTQRWVFRNDGTIFNLYTGLVMDVKDSDPSLHQIIIWPFTGNPNQKWLPLL